MIQHRCGGVVVWLRTAAWVASAVGPKERGTAAVRSYGRGSDRGLLRD
jgi:hypothetical protein